MNIKSLMNTWLIITLIQSCQSYLHICLHQLSLGAGSHWSTSTRGEPARVISSREVLFPHACDSKMSQIAGYRSSNMPSFIYSILFLLARLWIYQAEVATEMYRGHIFLTSKNWQTLHISFDLTGVTWKFKRVCYTCQ